jgi:hypothetical protein
MSKAMRFRRINPDNGQGHNQTGENVVRSLLISTAVAVSVLGAAAPAMAAARAGDPMQVATSGVTPVAHHPHYVNGRVPRALRGFDDPGYAYHGNINGCAEDLGYGRWESCDY